MHHWEKPKLSWMHTNNPQAALLQADIYTRGKLGPKQLKLILEKVQVFSPIYVEYMLIDREKHFKIEETNIIKNFK